MVWSIAATPRPAFAAIRMLWSTLLESGWFRWLLDQGVILLADDGLVTVFWLLTTTGTGELLTHEAGERKFVVDCRVVETGEVSPPPENNVHSRRDDA
jgi:hypothetical protein